MHALPPTTPIRRNLAALTGAPTLAAPMPAAPVAVAPATPVVPVPTEVSVTVTQRVTVTAVESRTDLLKPESEWGWEELRDYAVSEIVSRFGAFPRDSRKEFGIFSRFLKAHGTHAVPVVKFAFGPICNGWWGSAPISVTRFCKASDPYFAEPIIQRLTEAQ